MFSKQLRTWYENRTAEYAQAETFKKRSPPSPSNLDRITMVLVKLSQPDEKRSLFDSSTHYIHSAMSRTTRTSR
ncbi:hypothetical protein H6G27_23470 [Nostoc linckia FACHB-104]|nr:hypothetical protein [Nostoc linckia FACHB-104]